MEDHSAASSAHKSEDQGRRRAPNDDGLDDRGVVSGECSCTDQAQRISTCFT